MDHSEDCTPRRADASDVSRMALVHFMWCAVLSQPLNVLGPAILNLAWGFTDTGNLLSTRVSHAALWEGRRSQTAS
jgi:hypothetical protein